MAPSEIEDPTEDAQVAESVHRHGWHCVGVEGTSGEPNLAYTIGLCETHKHPDLVIRGLDHATAHTLFNDIVGEIERGKAFHAGQGYPGIIESYTIGFGLVDRTYHYILFGYAVAF